MTISPGAKAMVTIWSAAWMWNIWVWKIRPRPHQTISEVVARGINSRFGVLVVGVIGWHVWHVFSLARKIKPTEDQPLGWAAEYAMESFRPMRGMG